MTSVPVRREQTTPIATPIDPWDRWMRSFFGWEPMRLFGSDPLQRPIALERPSFIPAFEIKDTKEGLLFKADLPGIKEGDLEVMSDNSRITVKGKREEERKQETDTYYCYEREYGSFTRTFTLPEGCDAAKAHAELKEGVLTVLVPKAPGAQPRKIDVKTAK